MIAGREKLGQMLSEVTGLLRAHDVSEHCGLPSGEVLQGRVEKLFRAILHPKRLIRVLGGRSIRWEEDKD